MNTLLDILGSVFIAGLLLIVMMRLELFSKQTSYTSDNELKLIQNTKTLAEILEYDLRKIGYRHDKSISPAITFADSTILEFWSDIDSSGYNSINKVKYFISDSTNVTGTMNPSDIILNRTISDKNNNILNTMTGPSLGLVKIKFTYLNANQDTIAYRTQLDQIRYIKTEMWIESEYAVSDAFKDSSSYQVTYWEFTIHPRNI